jgi:hypothetical protein
MSKEAKKSSLLSKNFSTLFSPIRVDTDILDGKALALYKFSKILSPGIGSNVLNLLLDMENHSRKVIAEIEPTKRDSLIRELEGMTVEIQYLVKNKGKEILAVPIIISPVEVLKNAVLTKESSRYDEKMKDEITKIVISFIKKEIERKIKSIIENLLKALHVKPGMTSMFRKLLGQGLINEEGHLAEGTTIEDLISGKYSRQFKKVIPEELISETLLIRDTINTFYDWDDENYQDLANEALAGKGILEITLGEVEQKK